MIHIKFGYYACDIIRNISHLDFQELVSGELIRPDKSSIFKVKSITKSLPVSSGLVDYVITAVIETDGDLGQDFEGNLRLCKLDSLRQIPYLLNVHGVLLGCSKYQGICPAGTWLKYCRYSTEHYPIIQLSVVFQLPQKLPLVVLTRLPI